MIKRNQKIFSLSKQALERLVQESMTFKEVLEKLDLSYRCGYQRDLKTKLDMEQINYDKFKLHYSKRAGKKHPRLDKRDLKDILVENSDYTSTHLKSRLIKEKLLRYKCYLCGLENWQEKPISLELDHINGNHHDNRIENLRILCPNCHSQQTTEGAKNSKRKKETKHCSTCLKEIDRYSITGLCRTCFLKDRTTYVVKHKKPSKEELLMGIKESGGFVNYGMKIGVNRAIIRAWYKSYFPEEYR